MTYVKTHVVFRILMVTSSGKLTLDGLTITGGNTPGPAAASSTRKARWSSTRAGSPATPPRAG